MRRLALSALACTALAACGGQHRCSSAPVTDACASGLEYGSCMAQGGCWIRYYAEDGCQCPTRDSGKACTRSDQCEGACLVDGEECSAATAGTCSERRPVIGCFCYLDSEGKPGQLCVD